MAFSRGCLIVCFACCVLAARAGAAQESRPGPAVDPRVLIWLIEQLGSDDFAQREVAVRILQCLGEPALAALRRAALNDGNPEVRFRAAQVVRDIETRFREVTSLANLKNERTQSRQAATEDGCATGIPAMSITPLDSEVLNRFGSCRSYSYLNSLRLGGFA